MLEKYTHNKFIFLSVQKFIYTVHRYHFVNDPNDLWFSLQNISNFSLQNTVYFVILYRPTLLTRRFDILTMLTGNLIPFYAAYLSFFNTGWLRTLRFLSLLTQGNEMNGMNVWCAVFQFVYIFPWPFNIVYSPFFFYIQWYHVHNVFTKSDSEIS